MNLELQQSKQEVLKGLGRPSVARGAITNKYGQIIEVWEYALHKSRYDDYAGITTLYWLYFFNGRLVQWGEAGDWQREADRIYEIRFP